MQSSSHCYQQRVAKYAATRTKVPQARFETHITADTLVLPCNGKILPILYTDSFRINISEPQLTDNFHRTEPKLLSFSNIANEVQETAHLDVTSVTPKGNTQKDPARSILIANKKLSDAFSCLESLLAQNPNRKLNLAATSGSIEKVNVQPPFHLELEKICSIKGLNSFIKCNSSLISPQNASHILERFTVLCKEKPLSFDQSLKKNGNGYLEVTALKVLEMCHLTSLDADIYIISRQLSCLAQLICSSVITHASALPLMEMLLSVMPNALQKNANVSSSVFTAIAQALGDIGAQPQSHWCTTYCAATESLLPTLSMQELSIQAQMFSRCNIDPLESWVEAYYRVISPKICLLKIPELVRVLRDAAHLKSRPPAALVEDVLQNLSGRMDELSPKQMAMLLQSLGLLDYFPSSGWLQDLSESTRDAVRASRAPSISRVGHGLGLLRAAPNMDWQRAYVRRALKLLHKLTGPQLANVAFAVANFKAAASPDWVKPLLWRLEEVHSEIRGHYIDRVLIALRAARLSPDTLESWRWRLQHPSSRSSEPLERHQQDAVNGSVNGNPEVDRNGLAYEPRMSSGSSTAEVQEADKDSFQERSLVSTSSLQERR